MSLLRNAHPHHPKKLRAVSICDLSVDDRPGQLAKVAECMADHGISLATVSQTPHENDQPASLILTTHQTNEHSIAQVLEKLKDLPGVMDEPVLFRMFDPNGIS